MGRLMDMFRSTLRDDRPEPWSPATVGKYRAGDIDREAAKDGFVPLVAPGGVNLFPGDTLDLKVKADGTVRIYVTLNGGSRMFFRPDEVTSI